MPKHLTVTLRMLGRQYLPKSSHGFQNHKRHNKIKMHSRILWELYKNISATD